MTTPIATISIKGFEDVARKITFRGFMEAREKLQGLYHTLVERPQTFRSEEAIVTVATFLAFAEGMCSHRLPNDGDKKQDWAMSGIRPLLGPAAQDVAAQCRALDIHDAAACKTLAEKVDAFNHATYVLMSTLGHGPLGG